MQLCTLKTMKICFGDEVIFQNNNASYQRAKGMKTLV